MPTWDQKRAIEAYAARAYAKGQTREAFVARVQAWAWAEFGTSPEIASEAARLAAAAWDEGEWHEGV